MVGLALNHDEFAHNQLKLTFNQSTAYLVCWFNKIWLTWKIKKLAKLIHIYFDKYKIIFWYLNGWCIVHAPTKITHVFWKRRVIFKYNLFEKLPKENKDCSSCKSKHGLIGITRMAIITGTDKLKHNNNIHNLHTDLSHLWYYYNIYTI